MSDPTDPFFKDKRSGLAKLVGDQAVPTRVFDFEGAGGRFKGSPFAVRWLPAEARSRAAIDAVKFLADKCGWDRGDLYTGLGEAVLDLETKVRMLAVGLVEPKDPAKPLAKDADEVRSSFDVDEIVALFEELTDFLSERSALSKARTWEEVEGLVTALGKGLTPPTSLNSYASDTLRFMLRELARRHYSPTNRPSLGTMSPSDSSDASTSPTTG